jgi:hypothetical protein
VIEGQRLHRRRGLLEFPAGEHHHTDGGYQHEHPNSLEG